MAGFPSLSPRTARQAALALGAGRAVLGVTALVLPRLPLRPWVGEARADRHARLLARALGGRDLALGLGLLLAHRHRTPVRGWVEAGGLADAGDAVITAAYARGLPPLGRWLVVAAATGGAVAARLASIGVDAPGATGIDGAEPGAH